MIALPLFVGASLLAGNLMLWRNAQNLNDSLTHEQCNSLAEQILMRLEGSLLERADELATVAGLLKDATEPFREGDFLEAARKVIGRSGNFSAVSYMDEKNVAAASVSLIGDLIPAGSEFASKSRLDRLYKTVTNTNESKTSTPHGLMGGYRGIIIGIPLLGGKDKTKAPQGMIAGELPIDVIIQDASVVYDPSNLWIEMTVANEEVFNTKAWGVGSTHHLQRLSAEIDAKILGQPWRISVYPRAGSVFLGLYKDSTWRFVFSFTLSVLTSCFLAVLLVAVNHVLRSRELLRLSEKRYRRLFDNSPVPLWEEDFSKLDAYLEELKDQGVRDFRAYFDENPEQLKSCVLKVEIKDINQAVLKLHNTKIKEELLGDLERIFTQKSYETAKDQLAAIAAGVLEFETEAEVKTLTGEPRHVFLRLTIDRDQPKSVRGMLATVDITDRKIAEETLHKYEHIVSATSDLVSFVDRNYVYRAVNQAYLKYHNKRYEEIIGHSIADLHGTKLFKEVIKKEVDRCLTGEKVNYQGWFQYAAQGLRFMDVVYNAYFDAHDSISGVVVNARDITSQKRAQEALQESEERFREMAENIREVFWLYDLQEQKILYLSPAYEEVWGRPVQSLYDRSVKWTDCIHPDDLSYAVDSFKHILKREVGEPREYRIVRLDGTVRWILDRGFPIRDKDGRLYRVAGIAEDITERKQMEAALKSSERNYREIFNKTNDAMFIHSLDGRILDVNQALLDMTGYTKDEALNMRIEDFFQGESPYSQKETIKFVTKALEEGPQRFEWLGNRKNGESFWAEVNLKHAVIGDQDRIIAAIRDVTERKKIEEALSRYREDLEDLVQDRTRELKRAQEELVKREKLAVLGQLTATVSHELRNPLAAIRSSAFYLQSKIQPGDDKVTKHIRRIDKQVELCDSIVDDLLEYTRGRHSKTVEGEINPLLEHILDEIPETENVKIDKAMARKLPNVFFDPEKMRRVVVNLVNNASQAVSERKQIEKDEDYQPKVEVSSKGTNGGVLIVVKDNGIGMDEETRGRAFEPLFTTKARGTGLGLANVRKIVEEHDGNVSIESEPHEGTRVTVMIPVVVKD